MHEKPIPQPLLRLPSALALLALFVTLGHEVLGEVLAEVLEDEARFCDHERLGGGSGFEADHGRFAQRMDLFEFGGCEHVGASFVGFDVEGYLGGGAALEEPDYALGAGFLQPIELLALMIILSRSLYLSRVAQYDPKYETLLYSVQAMQHDTAYACEKCGLIKVETDQWSVTWAFSSAASAIWIAFEFTQ